MKLNKRECRAKHYLHTTTTQSSRHQSYNYTVNQVNPEQTDRQGDLWDCIDIIKRENKFRICLLRFRDILRLLWNSYVPLQSLLNR